MADDTNQKELTLGPVIIGGIVGSGVGLLTKGETGKKLASKVGQSAIVRRAGKELGHAAQEIFYNQARVMLQQGFSNSLSNYQQKITQALPGMKSDESKPSSSGEKSGEKEENDMTDKYNELKEENKELNENLNRIEEKVNKLLKALE